MINTLKFPDGTEVALSDWKEAPPVWSTLYAPWVEYEDGRVLITPGGSTSYCDGQQTSKGFIGDCSPEEYAVWANLSGRDLWRFSCFVREYAGRSGCRRRRTPQWVRLVAFIIEHNPQ